MIYKSENYEKLKKLLNDNLDYTLIAYPGGNKPRLKIIDKNGATVLSAKYDIVIEFALNELDLWQIEHNLRESNNDKP